MKISLITPLLIILIFYLKYVKPNHLNEINGELKIHCGKLCSRNGEAYFDKENLKCVCFLKRSIDDIDKRMMLKNAKGLKFKLELVAPKNIIKRKVEATTEIELKETTLSAKENPIGSILQAPPLLLNKKDISPERIAEIIKGLFETKTDLNELINKLMLDKVDKIDLKQEIETFRKNLRQIMLDDVKLQAIQDIKDTHLQLKSRFLPIKRSINTKSIRPELNDHNFQMRETTDTGNDGNRNIHSNQHDRHSSIIVQPPELIDE